MGNYKGTYLLTFSFLQALSVYSPALPSSPFAFRLSTGTPSPPNPPHLAAAPCPTPQSQNLATTQHTLHIYVGR